MTMSVGQLLVEDALPPPLRGRGAVLDKKGLATLLRAVAQEHPEDYRAVSKRLADIGRRAATETGGNSFGIAHLKKAVAGLKHQHQVEAAVALAMDDDTLDDGTRRDRIIRAAGAAMTPQMDEIYAESLAEKNPLALQVLSGARGNQMNLTNLRGSAMLYEDHLGQTVPVPILRSYSQGLTPEEYWAGTYGARKGVVDVKFATRDAGYLSKQLNQIAHRLVVTEHDAEDEPTHPRGMPVDTVDPSNEGALLAHTAGPYKRNTLLTPRILGHLHDLGHDQILVRSPTVGGPADGGVYARDVGVREQGTLPGRGTQVGLQSAQALSEPLSQSQLSSKHGGGVAGQTKGVSGFRAINQLVQIPSTFQDAAAHAEVDGTVDFVRPAAAGGTHVTIDGREHYVGRGFALTVKPGDRVEAGDVLSEGMPNPAIVVEHKGIGEGRRYFVGALHRTLADAGIRVNRRNVELIARGLINHVRLTDEDGDHVPGDVIPYSHLEHNYVPRSGAEIRPPKKSLGRYLERPVLHYSIGTRVRPSVMKQLEKFGVSEVETHPDPPPFVPEMIRGAASVAHDPDWMTRLYGAGQKGSLLEAAHHGGVSDEAGTSFVPALARSVDFGRIGPVKPPEPGVMPEEDHVPRLSRFRLNPGMPRPAPRPTPNHWGLHKLSQDAEELREALALLKQAGALDDLKQAKAESDRGNYAGKHAIIKRLLTEHGGDFAVDSKLGRFHGLTHTPSGFRIHAPRELGRLAVGSTAAKAASSLPYRDRVEMYAVRDGKVYGGIYDDKTHGVFGGGVEPGEDHAEAGAREFREESGRRVKAPVMLDVPAVTEDWKPPYKTPEQAERAKEFRGSRTHYAVGRLVDGAPKTVTDPSHLKHVRLRNIDTAIERIRKHGTKPRHDGRIAALEALRDHPHAKAGADTPGLPKIPRPVPRDFATNPEKYVGDYSKPRPVPSPAVPAWQPGPARHPWQLPPDWKPPTSAAPQQAGPMRQPPPKPEAAPPAPAAPPAGPQPLDLGRPGSMDLGLYEFPLGAKPPAAPPAPTKPVGQSALSTGWDWGKETAIRQGIAGTAPWLAHQAWNAGKALRGLPVTAPTPLWKAVPRMFAPRMVMGGPLLNAGIDAAINSPEAVGNYQAAVTGRSGDESLRDRNFRLEGENTQRAVNVLDANKAQQALQLLSAPVSTTAAFAGAAPGWFARQNDRVNEQHRTLLKMDEAQGPRFTALQSRDPRTLTPGEQQDLASLRDQHIEANSIRMFLGQPRR